MIIVGVCVLIAIFSITIYEAIGGKTIVQKQFKYMLLLGVVLAATLTYFIEPIDGWDLAAHFKEITRIRRARETGSTIVENYGALPVASLLFHFISYLPSVHFLPVVAVLLDGCIIWYLVWDYNSMRGSKSNQAVANAFLVSLAYINVTLCISGIRNSLACCIAVLGIYLGVLKNKRIYAIILGLIASGLHPFCMLIFVIYILNWIFKGKSKYIQWGALLVLPAIGFAIDNLKGLGIPIINYAAQIFSFYEENEFVTDIRITVIQVVALAVFYVKSKHFSRKPYLSVAEKEYFAILQIQIIATYGSISNPILFNRMLYPIGMLLCPMIYMIFQEKLEKNRKVLELLGITILYFGLLMYNFLELYNAINM